MSKLSFKAELNISKGKLNAGLELYKFTESDMVIIYCPALDLSAYGVNDKAAEKSFAETFRIHMTYCINKNTLVEDLKKHGWKIKSLRQKRIKAPTTEEMLKRNSTLKDIIYKKNYQKTVQEVEIAAPAV